MELQRNLDTIAKRGLGLAAISYESPDTVRPFVEKYGITFPLLYDEGSAVIKRYGILNTAATGAQAGIARPGTFILDPTRRVVARFFEQGHRERNTATSILATLDAAVQGRSARKIETDHLSIVASTSDDVAAPGTKFSLILDITPKPRMHVYAPEQTGYIPIGVTLEGDASFAAHPMRFPTPEAYHFKPLDEWVKVYAKPFRLTQEVTMSLSNEMRERAGTTGATLTIKGTLKYQACDDEVCYLPVNVPVEWSVGLRPLVVPERRQ